MQLTTEEVALASVALGGLIGGLGGTLRDRSNERRDHLKRLWEREVAVYESLLLEAASGRRALGDIRMRFTGDGSWPLELPDSTLDRSAQARVPIQLTMFGRDDVMRAYEESDRLVKDVAISVAQVYNAQQDVVARVKASGHASDRDVREWPEVSSAIEQVVRLIDAAEEADQNLTKVISAAVRSVPGRRIWPRRRSSLSTADIRSDFWDDVSP